MSYDPANDEGQLREELVAYLDGELDAEQSRRIEMRASEEPDARRMLEELDRTWHMLDELDVPATSEDFTRTTLEMVALAAVGDAEKVKAEAPTKRRRTALRAAAGLIAAAAAGFLIVATLAPDPNSRLLQDLPILENFDQYRQVDSVDFLRALNKNNLFPEDTDDAR
jgi:anti-sigma factor RsiW